MKGKSNAAGGGACDDDYACWRKWLKRRELSVAIRSNAEDFVDHEPLGRCGESATCVVWRPLGRRGVVFRQRDAPLN